VRLTSGRSADGTALGEPRKLVHRIESGALDAYPGARQIYLRWQELEAGVGLLLGGAKKVAMEYVPRNANPYVSRVDAGTIELVRSFGVEVVPSGDLVQWFEACWDDEQEKTHFDAAVHTRSSYDAAFGFIRDRVKAGSAIKESDVIKVILDHFERNGVETDHPPIVGVGPHSGDPHYEPLRKSVARPQVQTKRKAGRCLLTAKPHPTFRPCGSTTHGALPHQAAPRVRRPRATRGTPSRPWSGARPNAGRGITGPASTRSRDRRQGL
jgi:hypothetical protein